MSKFVKVMYGNTSGANSNLKYKIGEVNICDNWNPNADNPKDFGGFNYTTEDCIIRWLRRGDTIYDVEIPENAETIKVESSTTVYRTNMIIVKNPRKIDDDYALYLYKISNIPEKSYYKALAGVCIMNYEKTAYAIVKEKVSKYNIDEVLKEWNDYIDHNESTEIKNKYPLVCKIEEELYKIKNEQ